MDRFVRLFEEKKLKRVELYRSETFGEYREEIWCDINLTDIAIHRVNVYRRGYEIEFKGDNPDTIRACLSGDGELSCDVHHISDDRALYERIAINKNEVINLLNGISLLFYAKSSCRTDEGLQHCFLSSPLYPQIGNRNLNFNSITIEGITVRGENCLLQFKIFGAKLCKGDFIKSHCRIVQLSFFFKGSYKEFNFFIQPLV